MLCAEAELGQQRPRVRRGDVRHRGPEGVQQGHVTEEQAPRLVHLADHHARPESGLADVER
ncbi:hypothetical protein GCM10029963_55530 [Micromonospora andamanensis]